MQLYFTRNTCRLCGSENTKVVLPLAGLPIATPNFRLRNVDRGDAVYREAVPLDLHLCEDCGLLQVFAIGNRDLQYGNYVYTTSLSLGLSEHFKRYADEMMTALAPPAGGFVVEIGSNDGTLLQCFKAHGMRVLGVDPAPQAGAKARERGVPTVTAFFDKQTAARIAGEHGPADLIICNNTIANIDDLPDFLAGVADILADGGAFVFETQYGADVVRKNLLDTVYHEHLTYFNVKPITAYCERNGLEVFDVTCIETKGGSIRVAIQKKAAGRPVSPVVAELVAREIDDGMYAAERYAAYMDEIAAIRDELHRLVDEQRAKGKPVAGFGVSVGTTTLLAQFDLGGKIDCLFDDDPDKESVLSGPGYDIPVKRSDQVDAVDPGIVIVFAWRYVEPIAAKQTAYMGRGGKFILPLPAVKTY